MDQRLIDYSLHGTSTDINLFDTVDASMGVVRYGKGLTRIRRLSTTQQQTGPSSRISPRARI